MSKELTEKWKNGELEDGYYYVKVSWGIEEDVCQDYYFSMRDEWEIHINDRIKEVLAPVPSYDKVKELKEDNRFLKSGIETRDKQIERLQEQIKEANSVICGLYHLVTDKKAASGVVCDYLVKYGKPFEVKSGV